MPEVRRASSKTCPVSKQKKQTGATPLAMLVQGGYSSKHTLVSAPQVYHELQALDEM
jgi:hypothetical protein